MSSRYMSIFPKYWGPVLIRSTTNKCIGSTGDFRINIAIYKVRSLYYYLRFILLLYIRNKAETVNHRTGEVTLS